MTPIMSAEQIVEELASTGILKRSTMIKSEPALDSSNDDHSEKVDGKVSKT